MTMLFDTNQIIGFILSYKYVAIFLLMLGESILLPLPSEIVIMFSGFMVAVGVINPVFGFIDVLAGGLLSNWIDYIIGYTFGFNFILKRGYKLGYKMKNYKVGIRWMKKYGNYFAFITKTLPVIRVVSGLICGAFKMDKIKFTIYTLGGLVVWSAVLMYAGYILTNNWQLIAKAIMDWGLYIGIGAVVILLLIARHRLKSIFGMLKNLI